MNTEMNEIMTMYEYYEKACQALIEASKNETGVFITADQVKGLHWMFENDLDDDHPRWVNVPEDEIGENSRGDCD